MLYSLVDDAGLFHEFSTMSHFYHEGLFLSFFGQE